MGNMRYGSTTGNGTIKHIMVHGYSRLTSTIESVLGGKREIGVAAIMRGTCTTVRDRIAVQTRGQLFTEASERYI